MAELGTLLPPLSAVERGSTVVHAAPMRVVDAPQHGFSFPYPEFTALCGVEGWGEAGKGAEVTCKRCLRVIATRK